MSKVHKLSWYIHCAICLLPFRTNGQASREMTYIFYLWVPHTSQSLIFFPPFQRPRLLLLSLFFFSFECSFSVPFGASLFSLLLCNILPSVLISPHCLGQPSECDCSRSFGHLTGMREASVALMDLRRSLNSKDNGTGCDLDQGVKSRKIEVGNCGRSYNCIWENAGTGWIEKESNAQ